MLIFLGRNQNVDKVSGSSTQHLHVINSQTEVECFLVQYCIDFSNKKNEIGIF